MKKDLLCSIWECDSVSVNMVELTFTGKAVAVTKCRRALWSDVSLDDPGVSKHLCCRNDVSLSIELDVVMLVLLLYYN